MTTDLYGGGVRLTALISSSVLVLVTACGGGGGGSDGDLGSPVSATQVAEAPGIYWDVSPDGEWISWLDGSSTLCLRKVGQEADTSDECRDLGETRGDAVRWSPDSAAVVVVPDVWRTLRIGPIVVANIADSTLSEIVVPAEPDNIDGVAVEAAFVDDDTLIYWTVVRGEPPVTQFWSIDLDGSNHELLAEFDSIDGQRFTTLLGMRPLDGERVHMRAGERPGTAGLIEFDLAAGTTTELLPGERDLRPASPAAMGSSGDVILVADIGRLGDYVAASREGGLWTLLVDGRTITVPDRGFYRTQSVALSPDGSQLAMLETYLGLDVDDEEDPNRDNVMQTLEATRLSIATVESVVAGAPEWNELSGFSEFGTVADLDGLASGVVWTQPDRLWLELRDGLFEVALEPTD